ncbi:MAG: OmpA family protein [Catalinimonas sp.]
MPDHEDECPELAGVVAWKGCPDSDFDGVPDNEDPCPQVAGRKDLNGCSDRDLDGIADPQDECPTQYGSLENNGCPLVPVTSNDRLVNLTPDEQEVLRSAFEDLEFATGKADIQRASTKSLDALAEVLRQKQNYRLKVEGHTDDVGGDAANQKLSQARAEAVKTYIADRGVDAARIETEGFGEARPAAENNTEAGRQRNRRVELKVIE